MEQKVTFFIGFRLRLLIARASARLHPELEYANIAWQSPADVEEFTAQVNLADNLGGLILRIPIHLPC